MASKNVNRGGKLLKRIKDAKTIGGAPHLTEFVECMVREFGGAEAFAAEMKSLFDDAPKPMKLAFGRMMMKLVEVNSEMGGANNDLSQASDEDLESELKYILTGIKGLKHVVE